MKTRLKAEWAWATASRQPVIHEPLCATGEFVTVTFSGRGSGVVETRGFGASAALSVLIDSGAFSLNLG